MYNRYIPKQDGGYRRDRIPEPSPPPKPAPRPVPRPEPKAAPCLPSAPTPPPPCPPQQGPKTPGCGSFSFLKNLLPKGFDSGDLFIIILLLLMAGDCDEDRSTALLTLALYLAM